ncbi:hypothetical protein [Saguinine gammaherpesvirus 1]|uniref:Uncharacterized protein n=1 Tax=Saguinine gammaherpesvirus 1 TaxID=2169901 RepID=A0A9Q8QWU7_9GAMA|nr:hypothetical protein [Saguinine gammaherpesvirus 1]
MAAPLNQEKRELRHNFLLQSTPKIKHITIPLLFTCFQRWCCQAVNPKGGLHSLRVTVCKTTRVVSLPKKKTLPLFRSTTQ